MMQTSEITYSIVHHKSGSEYLAEFVGGDVGRAIEITSRDEGHIDWVSSLTPEVATDWLNNQSGDDLQDTANDLNAWIEARDAWIVRSPLDPQIR